MPVFPSCLYFISINFIFLNSDEHLSMNSVRNYTRFYKDNLEDAKLYNDIQA